MRHKQFYICSEVSITIHFGTILVASGRGVYFLNRSDAPRGDLISLIPERKFLSS